MKFWNVQIRLPSNTIDTSYDIKAENVFDAAKKAAYMLTVNSHLSVMDVTVIGVEPSLRKED